MTAIGHMSLLGNAYHALCKNPKGHRTATIMQGGQVPLGEHKALVLGGALSVQSSEEQLYFL